MTIRAIFYLLLSVLISACATTPQVHQARSVELDLGGGVSVPLQIWPVESTQRVLWLSSDKGFPAGMKRLAKRLQLNGVEVWQADVLAAEFLPLLASSMEKVSGKTLVTLVEKVLEQDKRALVLMADGHGAKLLTRFGGAWRNQYGDQWPKSISDIILISPNLYESTPPAGEEAKYIDSSGELGGRHIIFQPQLSPYRWWIERTVSKLKTKAVSVSVRPLDGVRDRFYFRADANAAEQKMEQQFANMIIQVLNGLKR